MSPTDRHSPLPDVPEAGLQLGASLARRLYPLVVSIALVIGIIFPATVYLLDYRNLSKEATYYAETIAHELEGFVADSPTLWKYQIYRYANLTRHFVSERNIVTIEVFDEKGNEAVNYRYRSDSAETWWNASSPSGVARMVHNNSVAGTVRVRISQQDLLVKTGLVGFLACLVGGVLSLMVFRYPIGIVQRMDEEVQTLIDDLENSIEESGRLRKDAENSEKRFRELVQGLDAIIWEGKPDSMHYSFVSHQAERLFGFPVGSWLDEDGFFVRQVHESDRERFSNACHAATSEDAPVQIEYRRHRIDGETLWLRDTFRIVNDGEGERHLWGVMVDVTPRVMAEEALLEANEKLSGTVRELRRSNREISVLQEMGDLFQLCNSLGETCDVVASVSEKLFPGASGSLFLLNGREKYLEKVATWGYSTEMHHYIFFPDTCRAWQSGTIHITPEQGTPECCEDISMPSCHNHTCFCIPLLAQGKPLGIYRQYYGKNQTGPEQLGHHQQLMMAMTEHMALAIANMKLRETLHVQAVRDPLTGLFNRRYADEAIAHEMAQAERKKNTFGIVMIDIDHFKQFNDTHGHDAGDLLLIKMAEVMGTFFREYDMISRYGGEEFICLLPDMGAETIIQRAEKLRMLIREIRINHLGMFLDGITASVGVAIYPLHGRSIQALLRVADSAMYRAKALGRDRVVVGDGETFQAGVAC